MKKRLLAWLLLMAMLLTVGAVAAAETNPNAGLGYYPGTSEKGWISVECSTMSKMNPFLQTYSTEFSINRHIWDCLVKLSPEDNSIVPAAAESWESSEDGMNWTFHIRKGMKWVNSKGEVIGDVTANDFVFAWRQLLNPANAAEYYAFATVFKNGQAYYDYASGVDGAPEVKIEDVGFKAADDYTLVCELENYLPYFLQYVKFEVMAPVYEPFYTEVGADLFGTAPEYICYNGPFYMSEWVLENSISCPKNESYWDADKVSLAGIKWVKYTDTNAKFNAFVGGELDVLDLTGEQRAMLEAEGYKPSNYMGGYSYWYWCNVKDTARDVANLNLRKAMTFALDRDAITGDVLKDGSTPAYTAVPAQFATGPDGSDFSADQTKFADDCAYDPEKAKEFFETAKAELGKDTFTFDMVVDADDAPQKVAQVVKEQLETTLEGLTINLTVEPKKQRVQDMQDGTFELGLTRWGPDYADPMTYLGMWVTGNSNNYGLWSDADYDAIIAECTTGDLCTDPEGRWEAMYDAESIVLEQAAIFPLYGQCNAEMISSAVTGVDFHPVALNRVYKDAKKSV